jgi:hypothetical protein
MSRRNRDLFVGGVHPNAIVSVTQQFDLDRVLSSLRGQKIAMGNAAPTRLNALPYKNLVTLSPRVLAFVPWHYIKDYLTLLNASFRFFLWFFCGFFEDVQSCFVSTLLLFSIILPFICFITK